MSVFNLKIIKTPFTHYMEEKFAEKVKLIIPDDVVSTADGLTIRVFVSANVDPGP